MKKLLSLSLALLMLLGALVCVGCSSEEEETAVVYTGKNTTNDVDVRLTVDGDKYTMNMTNLDTKQTAKVVASYSKKDAVKTVMLEISGEGVAVPQKQEIRFEDGRVKSFQHIETDCKKQGNEYIFSLNGSDERAEILDDALLLKEFNFGEDLRVDKIRDNYYEGMDGDRVISIQINGSKADIGMGTSVNDDDVTLTYEAGKKFALVIEGETAFNFTHSGDNMTVKFLSEDFNLKKAE